MAGTEKRKFVSNGQRLFVYIPEGFFKLDGLTILDANLLGLIAAFRGEGLRLSNNRLAELFNVERCTVIRSINKLRGRNYITKKGGNCNRLLIASSSILILLDSSKMIPGGSKTTPEVVSKSHKIGSKTIPINKGNKEKQSPALPSSLPYGASASAEKQSTAQESIISLADRKKMIDGISDSPFRRTIVARRR